MADGFGERLITPVRLNALKHASRISSYIQHAWRVRNEVKSLPSNFRAPCLRRRFATSFHLASPKPAFPWKAKRNVSAALLLSSRQPIDGALLWPSHGSCGCGTYAPQRPFSARTIGEYSAAAAGLPRTSHHHRASWLTTGRSPAGGYVGISGNPSGSRGPSSSNSSNGDIHSSNIRVDRIGRTNSINNRTVYEDSGTSEVDASSAGAGADKDPGDVSYSQRVARLRKPMLTAADKLSLEPKERARIFRALRTPLRQIDFSRDGGGGGEGSPSSAASASSPNHRAPMPLGPSTHGSHTRAGLGVKQNASLPLPLRVFCYGIDDVRLFRALEGADALGLVVVVPELAAADAVWATRRKRTGKALLLKEISNAARNVNKPFVELSTLSPVRVMEAVEALTGWPVPEHLLRKPPQPLVFLPPLEMDPTGSAEALKLLTGGLSLADYLITRAGSDFPPSVLRELDCTDLYESREELLPVNPQERESARQPAVFRPYMEGSRLARQRLLKEQMRRKAETEGWVSW